MKRERVHKVHTRPHAAAVTTVGIATVAAQQLLAAVGLDAAPLTVIGLTGAAAAAGGLTTLGHRWSPRGRLRARYGTGGWITHRGLRTALGRGTVRQAALEVRPSLATLTRRERRALPDSEFGIRIGRTITGPAWPRSLHYSHRDVALIIAPPQSGKTALLGNWIIDAPGAVVATSTKIDAHGHTAALRAQHGPVWVLNPENLGGLPSTFRWSPVDGCDEPAIAEERASYLVTGAGEGGRDARFWESQSVAVLRAYLMAAALDGRTMGEVAAWVANPTDEAALNVLKRYRGFPVPEAWIDGLRQVQSDRCAPTTRNSIYITLRLAVAFMGDPNIAQVCVPEPGARRFNVADFIADRGTLYLLGSERKHSAVAPLLACLTGSVFEECKRLAAHRPKGRHDPPILFALDEAALICPVPLDRWTSDAGGRGITLAIAVQAPAQLRAKWGRDGASTIQSNANVLIYFGGLTEQADLDAITSVCGERDEDSITDNLDHGARTPRSVTRRKARTITSDRLRELPQWHVLVLYRSAKPVIAEIRPVWTRPDVKATTTPLDTPVDTDVDTTVDSPLAVHN